METTTTQTNATTPPASAPSAGTETLLNSRRVIGSVILALVLLSAFLFAETISSLKAYSFLGSDITPASTVYVSGEGEVFAVPDTAQFTFTVSESADTVSAVQDAATKKTDAALAALKDLGIDETDIKTISYELHPKYVYEPATCLRYPCNQKQVQQGFTLDQGVQVKVRDLTKAGDALQAMTSAGVQNVSSLTFTIADDQAVKEEARKKAIDQAKAKAEQLASDLGVSLVRIVNFSENSGPMPYAMDKLAAPAGAGEVASAPSVPAGQNRIVSNVTITYEIR